MEAANINTHLIRWATGVCVAFCVNGCSQGPIGSHDSRAASDGPASPGVAADAGISTDARTATADAPATDASIIAEAGAVDSHLVASPDGVQERDGSNSSQRYRAIGIVTGEIHTCALLDDHRVKCWGSNSYGQLGYGDTVNRGATPAEMGDALPVVDLGSGRTVTTLAAGRYATCAILDDGSLKCWGQAILNGRYPPKAIGDQPEEMGDNLMPLDFGGRKATNIAIGNDVACASMGDNTIWCWGSAGAPVMVAIPSAPVRALSAASDGVFALYEDGTVSPRLPGETSPALASDHKLLAITGATGAATCALRDDGMIVCNHNNENTAVNPSGSAVALGIEEFQDTACGLFTDGSVKCPADDPGGECPVGAYWCGATGAIALRESATAITNNGDGFMCALLATGDVKCWGTFEGDPTPREWLGSGVSLLSVTNGVPNYSPWNPIDLGTHP